MLSYGKGDFLIYTNHKLHVSACIFYRIVPIWRHCHNAIINRMPYVMEKIRYRSLLIYDSRYMNNYIQFTPDYIRDYVIVKSFPI